MRVFAVVLRDRQGEYSEGYMTIMKSYPDLRDLPDHPRKAPTPGQLRNHRHCIESSEPRIRNTVNDLGESWALFRKARVVAPQEPKQDLLCCAYNLSTSHVSIHARSCTCIWGMLRIMNVTVRQLDHHAQRHLLINDVPHLLF